MMQPIFDFVSGVPQLSAAVSGVKESPKVQTFEDEASSHNQKPVRDEYIPGEKQERIGRYWMGKDEDGHPKIYFDDSDQAADHFKKTDGISGADDSDGESKDQKAEEPDEKAGDGSEKKVENRDKNVSGDKEERCKGSTDKVDREIEKLKKRKKELEQQIRSETDERKIRELEKNLAQVERELRQKDNDGYRRQHAEYTNF